MLQNLQRKVSESKDILCADVKRPKSNHCSQTQVQTSVKTNIVHHTALTKQCAACGTINLLRSCVAPHHKLVHMKVKDRTSCIHPIPTQKHPRQTKAFSVLIPHSHVNSLHAPHPPVTSSKLLTPSSLAFVWLKGRTNRSILQQILLLFISNTAQSHQQHLYSILTFLPNISDMALWLIPFIPCFTHKDAPWCWSLASADTTQIVKSLLTAPTSLEALTNASAQPNPPWFPLESDFNDFRRQFNAIYRAISILENQPANGLAGMSDVELDAYLAGLEAGVSTTMVTVATSVGATRTPV
jgi:hypothetical protein